MRLRNLVIILTIILVSSCYAYWAGILSLGSLSQYFFSTKFVIRFGIFQLIFLFNVIILASEGFSKYWFISYLMQISFFLYLNRSILYNADIVDLICLYCFLHVILIISIFLKDKYVMLVSTRYKKGLKKQEVFYNTFIKNYRLLNNIFFFRNLIVLRLGSLQVPVNPSIQFWLLFSVFSAMVWYLAFVGAVKTIFSICIFCFVINAKYETIIDNYNDSKVFRKNFDVNRRFWRIKLNNKEKFVVGGLIKRTYVKEFYKIVYEGGELTATNPRIRTIVVLGTTLFIIGGTATIGAIVKTNIQEKQITERQKNELQFKAEESEKDRNFKAEESEKDRNFKEKKLFFESSQADKQREHEYRMAKLENDKKKYGWGWPFK